MRALAASTSTTDDDDEDDDGDEDDGSAEYWFYLDRKGAPAGPHLSNEMATLYRKGVVKESTKVRWWR